MMKTRFMRQRGAVLVVGLILLVVVSLLGTVAYGVATQQERISGNTRDRMLAFDMAESALRFCEAAINSPAFVPLGGVDQPLNGLYVAPAIVAGDTSGPRYETIDWTNDALVRELTFPAGSDRYAIRPACIAEDTGSFFEPDRSCGQEIGCAEIERQSFRVTARGYGVRPDTIVDVQSNLRR